MLKRLLVISLALVVVIGTLAACPGPPEEVTPTPPEEEKPAPEEPTPTPTGPEEFVLEIAGGTVGGSGYVVGYAAQALLEKYHPWLRGKVTTVRGGEALGLWMNKPETGKYMIAEEGDTSAHEAAMGRIKGLEGKKYTGARAILCYQSSRVCMVTLDPNIKSIADFAGKAVSLGPKGAVSFKTTMWALFDEYGIRDKVKEAYFGWSGGKDALLDGRIDVAMVTTYWVQGNEFSNSAGLEELLAQRRPIYFVDYFDMDRFNHAMEVADVPIVGYVVPAGTLGSRQPNAFHAFSSPGGWWCDETMDDEVVYELVKFAWEYHDEFKEYASAARSFDRGKFTNHVKELYHPAAITFYKEMGVWPKD